MKNRKYFFAVFIFLCLVFGTGCQKSVSVLKSEESVEILQDAQVEEMEELTKDSLEDTSEVGSSQEQKMIFVDVSGAVLYPGVYQLQENSRVFQAIEAAGGCTEDAESSLLNQAELLQDGQKIYVYTKQEAKDIALTSTQGLEVSESAAASDGKVNINKAGKADLMTLPGVGETRAEAILTYRQENGSFSSIEELMNVEGIKEKTYEKLKDKITV
ncbi:MAG: helix-hairpin-helix domain-containing protein [Ruminococcus sp.]|nr:helix-hairpin-helix domain-containing protein [Ruminococcus sp.]